MIFKRKDNRENKRLNINQTEKSLRKMAMLPLEQLLNNIESNREGLSSIKAEEVLEKNGENKIVTAKEKSSFLRLMEAFVNPFNGILFLMAIITLFTDVFYAQGESKDYKTFIIIISLVVISSVIAFIQGERSNNAAASLSDLIGNKVDVFRDNEKKEIDMKEVVVGDVIKFAAGDIIPGDIRFLSTKDAFISQATLTGESNPVEKFSTIDSKENTSLTDISNLGFMGSNMVSGSAKGIILTTGNDTYFGSMAKSLSNIKYKNSFERGVEDISKLLLKFMFIMVPLIFLINGIVKKDWVNSFIFAVTVAVGLTPEMLPVIMTSTLAKGAVSMSKHDTIVKSLSSIQTFGEMDILCTDKTGTLTEDKIILEVYMDAEGNINDDRILKHAYLNSSFQTGLKNLIDIAIIKRGDQNNLQNFQNSYKLIDEIPFDFSRRRMSVILDDEKGKRQLITKGAVDEILQKCSYVDIENKIMPFTDELMKKVYKIYEKHNNDGLRIIAIAQRNRVEGIEHFSVEDEKNLVLLGFIGFLDPPKKSAEFAIKALKENGVRTVVLTGDSEGVAIKVCNKVGVNTKETLQGHDIENMSEEKLEKVVKSCDLFSKLSPSQKERVVKAFQKLGHTVGYMGDGINDALTLRQADIGISVDSAVDIAKESANIILLKKDLMVLEKGVLEGRKTFVNIIKYIKMATSGNLGNMISVLLSTILLPFLPLLPVQILAQNLLCDFSQLGIPFDNVDAKYMKYPRKWDTRSIEKFMLTFGPLSTIFDLLCWGVMIYIFKANNNEMSPLFQNGWFLFGTLSQIVIVYMIRTSKTLFINSKASKGLVASSMVVGILTMVISFSKISSLLEMNVLPIAFAPWLVLLLLSYCIVVQFAKRAYIKKYGEWL